MLGNPDLGVHGIFIMIQQRFHHDYIYLRNMPILHVTVTRVAPKTNKRSGERTVSCIYICVYRPPLSTRSDFDQEILSALIKTSKMKYDGFIICGDFNHTSLSWSDEGQPYLNATLGGNAVSKLFCDAPSHLYISFRM